VGAAVPSAAVREDRADDHATSASSCSPWAGCARHCPAAHDNPRKEQETLERDPGGTQIDPCIGYSGRRACGPPRLAVKQKCSVRFRGKAGCRIRRTRVKLPPLRADSIGHLVGRDVLRENAERRSVAVCERELPGLTGLGCDGFRPRLRPSDPLRAHAAGWPRSTCVVHVRAPGLGCPPRPHQQRSSSCRGRDRAPRTQGDDGKPLDGGRSIRLCLLRRRSRDAGPTRGPAVVLFDSQALASRRRRPSRRRTAHEFACCVARHSSVPRRPRRRSSIRSGSLCLRSANPQLRVLALERYLQNADGPRLALEDHTVLAAEVRRRLAQPLGHRKGR
jgi:hypothetical protein